MLTSYFAIGLLYWMIFLFGYRELANILSMNLIVSRQFAMRVALPFACCIMLLVSSAMVVHFARINPRRSTILLVCVIITSVLLFTYDTLTHNFQVSFMHLDGRPKLYSYLYCNWWWYDR